MIVILVDCWQFDISICLFILFAIIFLFLRSEIRIIVQRIWTSWAAWTWWTPVLESEGSGESYFFLLDPMSFYFSSSSLVVIYHHQNCLSHWDCHVLIIYFLFDRYLKSLSFVLLFPPTYFWGKRNGSSKMVLMFSLVMSLWSEPWVISLVA